MKKIKHFKMLPLVLVLAYLLSACGGALPGNVNTNEAVSTIIAIASSTPIIPVTGTTPQPGDEVEIFGVVESMTEMAITVNGVTYNIVADLTEFNDVISVGDQVKIHVILNADGTFTIREIEISIGDDNGNDNANGNSNDDPSINSNDDNGNDNDANSNDDNNNANSNDDNSNDDNGNNSGNNNDNDSSGSGSGGNGNDDDGGNNNNNDSNNNG